MALLDLRDLRLSLGGPRLFDGLQLTLHDGERVGLLGRNGAGKSTLLRVIDGQLPPDSGDVVVRRGARVAFLEQDPPLPAGQTALDVVLAGLGGDESRRHEAEAWLSRVEVDPAANAGQLSGGQRRRVALARALAPEPDLLLLDEPTNHLDLDAITWLEGFLKGAFRGAVVFVTHDRAFLQTLATRVVELDRGRLLDFAASYDEHLRRREALFEQEEREQDAFDKKLAEEEAWIRRGVKARRTRNEGRVRALKAMRTERQARRETLGTADVAVVEGKRAGKRVAEAKNVSFGYDPARPLVQGLTTTVLRGDKVGLIGPNGAGKTTLIRLLLGELEPQAGVVTLGPNLQVAYFDQQRLGIDPDWSVADNVTGRTGEFVQIGDQKRHVYSYLKDFLFEPERARMMAGVLSGGERARLLLAQLFTRPANVLVLDEPTNDLDLETLEVLETLLVDFPGTVLTVSHDRAFLDNVVSSTLVLDGDGHVKEYVGGYSDVVRQQKKAAKEAAAASKGPSKAKMSAPVAAPAPKPKKLSYKEQRELEALPARIETLEAEQAALYLRLADPAIYQDADADAVTTVQDRLAGIAQELAQAYKRWEALEAQQEAGQG